MKRSAILALALAACSSPADGPDGSTTAGPTGPGADGSSGDAPTGGAPQTGGSGVDPTTSADTGPGETGPGDTGPADTGPDDTGAAESESGGDAPDPYPDPGTFPPNSGPGGPTVEFTPEQVGIECAALDGGMPGDLGGGEDHDTFDHHNLVVMFDGWLVMPWAPEYGINAGVTFYDFADPCAPVAVASKQSDTLRESHSLGFANLNDRWYMVADMMDGLLNGGGVEFWDVTDVHDLQVVSRHKTKGFFYPDAYAKVTLSVFWQAPYVYVAGADLGIFVVDASDPTNPVAVGDPYKFDPTLRVGQVQAVGNLLMVSAAEGTRTALLDISKPTQIQPIPGGEFPAARESYFSNIGGGYAYYAPKSGGGGILIYDIHDPTAPSLVADYSSGGNGGYVFVKDQHAFVGESDFATIYDLTDVADPVAVTQLDLTGDLDTITPIANVAVLSVDDKADKDRGSIVVPYLAAADTTPPTVTWAYPPDGAVDLAVTSRFGLTFNEMIDVKSAWAGSVRLYETGTDPATTRVDGHVSAQEHIVNFAPRTPLAPDTRYTLEVPAGGVRDYSGNAIAAGFTATFTTRP